MKTEVNIDDTRYLIIDWNEVNILIDELADKIETRDNQPNLIIGILRGGMSVANILADRLGVYNIRSIGAKLYKRTGEIGEKLEIYQSLPLRDLKNYNVLIVEDIIDTGSTFLKILEDEINPKNPSRLCTASLHIKSWAKYRPDVYIQEVDSWVGYPWDICEIGRDVYRNLLMKYDMETARKEFLKKFKVEPQIIRRIIESTELKLI